MVRKKSVFLFLLFSSLLSGCASNGFVKYYQGAMYESTDNCIVLGNQANLPVIGTVDIRSCTATQAKAIKAGKKFGATHVWLRNKYEGPTTGVGSYSLPHVNYGTAIDQYGNVYQTTYTTYSTHVYSYTNHWYRWWATYYRSP